MTTGLKPVMHPEEIRSTIDRIAGEIQRDYAGKTPVLVCVLKGALIFLADLMRSLDMPFEIDSLQTSCYGKKDCPGDAVSIIRDTASDVKDRNILLVETMIDRGLTMSVLMEHMQKKGAASIAVCSLLARRSRMAGHPKIDYLGKEVEDGFVVGYGLDYKERFRGLPGLYLMESAGKG